MKSTVNILKSLSATLIIIFMCHSAVSAETVAFGYFTNKSESSSMDYLQKVLPNSFASALKNKHNVSSLKPGKIPILNSKESKYTGKEIEDNDLIDLSSYIRADYFVFGNFTPLSGNRIRLTIKVHKTNTTKVFSFTEEGRLETEIFRLVDRITFKIKNIASDSMLYKAGTIVNNSKVSIITNIEGEDLNILYYNFMKNGYKLSSVQGNEIYTHLDENSIMSLYTVHTQNASYKIIADRSEVELLHGTWSGAQYYRDLIQQRDIYNKYAFNFEKTIENFTNRALDFDRGSFEYLIIIGFNDDKNTAWIRGISLKDNKLITAESEITGGNIEEISVKIINSLRTELSEKS
ncbi:MAG TPA: hypothetical protein PK358_02185 [Spirochaetota bacterium]|nr:hypothetical protein [Spirochaetota bacterium]HPJ33614.1 hypothetical protein [Spirochaetota bacterium]